MFVTKNKPPVSKASVITHNNTHLSEPKPSSNLPKIKQPRIPLKLIKTPIRRTSDSESPNKKEANILAKANIQITPLLKKKKLIINHPNDDGLNSLNVSLINGKLKEEFLREIKCGYPNIKVQIPTKGPISNSIKVVDLLSPSTNFRANKTISNAIKPPKYPKAHPKFDIRPLLLFVATLSSEML